MFDPRLLITSLLAFAATAQSTKAMNQDGYEFLENILQFYGENKTISTDNLEDLLLLISARRSHLISAENPLENKEVCQ